MIEAMESRRFLTVTAHLQDGTVFVRSDDAPDRVGIGMTPDGAVVVRANEANEPVGVFHANEVMRINVDLGAGDDGLGTFHLNRPMMAHGGPGNDRMQGGMRSDRLFGDTGNDRFQVAGGGEDFVDGGEGDDGALIDHHDHVVRVEHIHFMTNVNLESSFSVVHLIGLSEEPVI